jgi:hypothetical protein
MSKGGFLPSGALRNIQSSNSNPSLRKHYIVNDVVHSRTLIMQNNQHRKTHRAVSDTTNIPLFHTATYSFYRELHAIMGVLIFHSKAATPRSAARKPPGIPNGTAALDGAVVVCDVDAAEADELAAELLDALALLLLLADAELEDADAELADAELADAELADAELADAELAEEPEEDEAEALPVSVASNAV